MVDAGSSHAHTRAFWAAMAGAATIEHRPTPAAAFERARDPDAAKRIIQLLLREPGSEQKGRDHCGQ